MTSLALAWISNYRELFFSPACTWKLQSGLTNKLSSRPSEGMESQFVYFMLWTSSKWVWSGDADIQTCIVFFSHFVPVLFGVFFTSLSSPVLLYLFCINCIALNYSDVNQNTMTMALDQRCTQASVCGNFNAVTKHFPYSKNNLKYRMCKEV